MISPTCFFVLLTISFSYHHNKSPYLILNSCKEDYDDISDLSLEDNSWERLTILDSASRRCIPGECDCCCHGLVPKKFCTFCSVKVFIILFRIYFEIAYLYNSALCIISDN